MGQTWTEDLSVLGSRVYTIRAERFAIRLVGRGTSEDSEYTAYLQLKDPFVLIRPFCIQFQSRSSKEAKALCLQQFSDSLRGLFEEIDAVREDDLKEKAR